MALAVNAHAVSALAIYVQLTWFKRDLIFKCVDWGCKNVSRILIFKIR